MPANNRMELTGTATIITNGPGAPQLIRGVRRTKKRAMETWYERVRSRVPAAPVVRELVECVEQLPGLDGWSPTHGIENHWTDLIAWGFVLWMTRSLAGVDALRQSLANEILASGRPAPDTFAELSAAGLCVAFRPTAGGRIPRSGGKTADWRMIWPPDLPVDVEVTVARRKEAHRERQALATDLAQTLFRPQRDVDLVVHLADPVANEDRAEILSFSEEIVAGVTKGIPGRWELRCEQITREPTVLLVGGMDSRPPWWSEKDACCFVLQGQIAGPDARRAPAQVRVHFGVPYDSYVNPVMRKADFPQGEPGLPFLVVLDVSTLPGAFNEMPRALAGFLPLWKGVSGILLFQDMMAIERVGWAWRLLSNPDAAVPLPAALAKERADLPNRMETGLKLNDRAEDAAGAA